MERDREAGLKLGVTATPTVLVNDQRLMAFADSTRLMEVVRNALRDRQAAVRVQRPEVVLAKATLAYPMAPVARNGTFCQAVEVKDVETRVRKQAGPGGGTIRLAATPSIEIGSTKGEGGADFSAITSVAFVQSGRLAVSDHAWRNVRLFDLATGALRSTLGQEGQGPGEFATAPVIAASPTGGVWAWDPSNRRLYEFALDGTLRSSRSLSGKQIAVKPMNTWSDGWIVAPSGAIISVASDWWSTDVDEQQILLLDLRDTDATQFGPDTRRHVEVDRPHVLPNPFRALRQVVAWADGIAISSPDESWEVAVYGFDGKPIRRIRLPLQGPEVRGEVFNAEKRYYESRYREAPQLVRLLDEFRSVRRASAIVGILSSGDGTLWVRRWRSRDPAAPDCFDVVDVGGSLIATVAIPADYGRVIAVSPSRVVTVWLDNYDVPRLRVYPLLRAPRPDDLVDARSSSRPRRGSSPV